MSYHFPQQPLRGLHGEGSSEQKAGIFGVLLATLAFGGLVAYSVSRSKKEDDQNFKAHLRRARKTYGGKDGKLPFDIEREIYKAYNKSLPARLQTAGSFSFR